MNPIMTVYAAMAVPGVVTIVLLFLLVNIKDSGKGEVHNARWVTVKGGRKIRNATVKELWEHNNPGKRWDAAQEKYRKIRVIVAIPIAIFIPLIATKVFCTGQWMRDTVKGNGPVWITYLTVLGMGVMAADVFLGLMNMMAGMNVPNSSLVKRLIGYITILLSGLGLLYMIVFGVVGCIAGLKDKEPAFAAFRFYEKSLKIVLIGAGVLLLVAGIAYIIHVVSDTAEKKKTEKNGPSEFVMELVLNPYLSCSSCRNSLQSIGRDTVWLMGKGKVICASCHTPWSGGGTAINYRKAQELADDIRKAASKR